MEKSPERKESMEVEVRMLSSQELIDRVYQGKSLPQDNRFLSFDKGGAFRYFNPGEIEPVNPNIFKLYPVIESGGEIVSMAELEQDPEDKNNFWIKFASTDPQHQGNGYASKLIRKIFEFAKENSYSLQLSSYSEEGLEKLKNVIERLEKETGVKVIRK